MSVDGLGWIRYARMYIPHTRHNFTTLHTNCIRKNTGVYCKIFITVAGHKIGVVFGHVWTNRPTLWEWAVIFYDAHSSSLDAGCPMTAARSARDREATPVFLLDAVSVCLQSACSSVDAARFSAPIPLSSVTAPLLLLRTYVQISVAVKYTNIRSQSCMHLVRVWSAMQWWVLASATARK